MLSKQLCQIVQISLTFIVFMESNPLNKGEQANANTDPFACNLSYQVQFEIGLNTLSVKYQVHPILVRGSSILPFDLFKHTTAQVEQILPQEEFNICFIKFDS